MLIYTFKQKPRGHLPRATRNGSNAWLTVSERTSIIIVLFALDKTKIEIDIGHLLVVLTESSHLDVKRFGVTFHSLGNDNDCGDDSDRDNKSKCVCVCV